MDSKGVRERDDHEVFVRRLIAEYTCFKRNIQRSECIFQIGQHAHSFETSSSNVCIMAASQALFEAFWAGFKKGRAG